jgi:aryl-alcohol dehydrogenase-like predicted oxidoreductase
MDGAMTLPEASRIQLTSDLGICRILNGMWQVSGAHGPIDPRAAVENMFEYLDSGFTTWDLADHYGPAEDFIGRFRSELAASRGAGSLSGVQAFTKWVPRPGKVTRGFVDESVAVSLRRMGVETLDLLQFHWWDYADDSYLDALTYLSHLQQEGKIRFLGLTNFDTEHLKRIVSHGIGIVSNQVQFSLIDRRPEVQMVQFCEESGIQLLTYGTLCGGLLTDKYLGQPQPKGSALDTASLSKYARMVEAWGDWGLFQQLLVTLRGIGDKHGMSIAAVAVRYILDRPTVAGVIVGARLGRSDHREENGRVFDFALDGEDLDRIEAILRDSRDLYRLIGDCGDEYRS